MNEVDAVARAVGIRKRRGVHRITWIGETVADLDDPDAASHLADVVYANAYVRGGPHPIEPPADRGRHAGWADVQVDERMAARWSGWTAAGDGSIEAPGQPRLRYDGASAATPGAEVVVPLPVISTGVVPGWCYVHHGDIRSSGPALRLYANTCPDRMQERMLELTGALADAEIDPVSAKLLLGGDHLDRADSTVVYLPAVPPAALLARLVEILQGAVSSATTPMFTRGLAPGIAIAHAPPDGASFGHLRSKQVARAIVDRFAARSKGPLELPFDGGRPWNGPGPELLDALAVPDHRVRRAASAPPTGALSGLEAHACELDRTAILAEGRASWLVQDIRTGRLVTAGADVYSGAAGPLGVLAHAVRLGGGVMPLRLVRATARAMLDRQPELPPEGFHAGQPGTAAVLAEAATVTGDDEMTALAHESLGRARTARWSEREWDVIAGVAGSILGLGAAGALLGVDVDDDISRRCEVLLSRASDDRRSGGLRWHLSLGTRRPALAGLAHGASGAAMALAMSVAMAGATDDRHLSAVERAVRFEDTCRQNADGWTDHRNPTSQTPATVWCHGAAGIAVASASLAQRDAAGGHAARARLAGQRLAAALDSPLDQRCLCHGTAGQALALAVVSEHLGDADLAGVARGHLAALPPPPGQPEVGLMTGECGVVLARLVGAGLASPPLAFVLDAALVEPIGGPQVP